MDWKYVLKPSLSSAICQALDVGVWCYAISNFLGIVGFISQKSQLTQFTGQEIKKQLSELRD